MLTYYLIMLNINNISMKREPDRIMKKMMPYARDYRLIVYLY